MTMSWIEAGCAGPSGVHRTPRAAAVSPIVLAELLVVGLGPAAHDGGQRMAGGAEVPAPDPGALVELDADDLAVVRRGAPRPAVEIEVDAASRTRRPPRLAEREIFGGDQPARGPPPGDPAGRSRRTGRASSGSFDWPAKR